LPLQIPSQHQKHGAANAGGKVRKQEED